MSYPAKGKADYLALGDWNCVCYDCGRKFKASQMRRNWQGFWECPEHWTPRQPQDFVRGVPDNPTPPWTQPMPANVFVYVCDIESMQPIADIAVAECAVAGADGGLAGSAIAGIAIAGIAISGSS